jgi:hypothetical protein
MTTTPRSTMKTITTDEKMNRPWRLAVSYWVGQEIRETFSVGKTRGEALKNWYFQYYQGNVPENPRFPSNKDTIFISWVKFVPAK